MFQRIIWRIKNNIDNRASKIKFGHFAHASIKIIDSVVDGENLTFGTTWNMVDCRDSCLSISKSGLLLFMTIFIYIQEPKFK